MEKAVCPYCFKEVDVYQVWGSTFLSPHPDLVQDQQSDKECDGSNKDVPGVSIIRRPGCCQTQGKNLKGRL